MDRLSLRNNQLKFKNLKKITHHFIRIYGIYLKSMKKTKRSQHVTGWSGKHWDSDQIYPKISPDTAFKVLMKSILELS